MATIYDARDLADAINYIGQEQAARKLFVKMNTIPVEQLVYSVTIQK